MNRTKGKPATERPHNGCVVGAGVGHKFRQHYGIETKEQRKERKKSEAQEAQDLREKVTRMEANLPNLIQDGVATTIGIILQTLQNEEEGRQASGPLPSEGASNSTPPLKVTPDLLARLLTVAKNVNSASAQQDPPAAANNNDALALRENPTASNNSPRRQQDSPALITAPRRSPSISCTPV